MARYLFGFGYQPDCLWGTDLEDSECVWIDALDEASALAWGREVAEAFIAARWPHLPSWKTSSFAHWIEHSDPDVLKWAEVNQVPNCRAGEIPVWPAEDQERPTRAWR